LISNLVILICRHKNPDLNISVKENKIDKTEKLTKCTNSFSRIEDIQRELIHKNKQALKFLIIRVHYFVFLDPLLE